MEAMIKISVTTIIISRREKPQRRLGLFGPGRCTRPLTGAMSIAPPLSGDVAIEPFPAVMLFGAADIVTRPHFFFWPGAGANPAGGGQTGKGLG